MHTLPVTLENQQSVTGGHALRMEVLPHELSGSVHTHKNQKWYQDRSAADDCEHRLLTCRLMSTGNKAGLCMGLSLQVAASSKAAAAYAYAVSLLQIQIYTERDTVCCTPSPVGITRAHPLSSSPLCQMLMTGIKPTCLSMPDQQCMLLLQ